MLQWLEAFLVNPYTTLAVALVLTVVGVKLNTAASDFLLGAAWLCVALSVFRSPPFAKQLFVERALWTMLLSAVVGLGLLWLARWQPKKDDGNKVIAVPPGALAVGPSLSAAEEQKKLAKESFDGMSPGARVALRRVLLGPASESELRSYVESKGSAWDPEIPKQLEQRLAVRDFSGKFSLPADFAPIVRQFFPDTTPTVSVAAAKPITSPSPKTQPATKDKIDAALCDQLGALVVAGNKMLDRLVAERASDAVQEEIQKWHAAVEAWLVTNAPRKLVTFQTAPESDKRPMNYPSAHGRLYGRFQGQITAARAIYMELCP